MRIWSLFVLAVACVASSAAAHKGPATKTPGVSAPALVAADAVGTPVARSEVFVLWGGSYWPAWELARRGGMKKIRYVGYGPEWDEWVGPERLRARPPHVSRPQVGQRVLVEWHGSWWLGEVLVTRAGLTKIHYTGWGPEWDEWVEAPRLRADLAPPVARRVKR